MSSRIYNNPEAQKALSQVQEGIADNLYSTTCRAVRPGCTNLPSAADLERDPQMASQGG